MIKLMTIVGTRPELIKMCMIIKKIDKLFKHTLVHTGQNYDYELNEIFYNDLEIRKPDYFLNCAKKNLADTIASVISETDKVFAKIRPDAILLYGDTNSCLSVIPAKRRKIPIFHMEAGNRCFDQNVPEEINRKIVDHLSDINFVLTEHARRYLIEEGIPQQTIIKTGTHMREVLNHFKDKIHSSNILNKLKLKKDNYFLVSAHREENIDNDENFVELINTLNNVEKKYHLPIIFSTHPRTKKKITSLKKIKINKNIKFIKPTGFTDYIKLQQNAKCCLSDSGTITEETDILGLKSINLRYNHERPEGNDQGTLILSGLISERVIDSIELTLKINHKASSIPDYNEEEVSSKIIKNVISHIDYVNKYVWNK